MLVKVLCIGICAAILNIILKQYKPEFSLLINICAGLLMFMLILSEAESIINSFLGLDVVNDNASGFITPIVKVVGVGYITEFVSDLAEESGNKSIAGKIVLGGKIAICVMALPIIKNLINAILSLI